MTREIRSVYRPRDDLRAARGLLKGLWYSLVFWIIAIVMAAVVLGGYFDWGAR